MDLILTGRRVNADEALKIGLCEYVVPDDEAREKAEALAKEIAKFPQSCVKADRRSTRNQHGLSLNEALRQEWLGSKDEVTKGIEGAGRFAGGKGRGGDFKDV
jgi:enoyl-CoA hydratase